MVISFSLKEQCGIDTCRWYNNNNNIAQVHAVHQSLCVTRTKY
jgi:hypothetical protein